jgi:hypothetical protein
LIAGLLDPIVLKCIFGWRFCPAVRCTTFMGSHCRQMPPLDGNMSPQIADRDLSCDKRTTPLSCSGISLASSTDMSESDCRFGSVVTGAAGHSPSAPEVSSIFLFAQRIGLDFPMSSWATPPNVAQSSVVFILAWDTTPGLHQQAKLDRREVVQELESH